jgi:hypothetical protein
VGLAGPAHVERNLLSGLDDIDVVQHLIAELHDGLRGRAARLHMLTDLSRELGMTGAMLPGGTISYRAWTEARGAFINGYFVAAVLLSQGLMEHLLASELESRLDAVQLPPRTSAKASRRKAKEVGLITDEDERELAKLEGLRNPLTHYRSANDPEHVDQQSMLERSPGRAILERNAVFAVTLAMRMLAKPSFRLP